MFETFAEADVMTRSYDELLTAWRYLTDIINDLHGTDAHRSRTPPYIMLVRARDIVAMEMTVRPEHSGFE